MATYTKHTQYIIRIEFHDVKDAPDVYNIFYNELKDNIFLDQIRQVSGLTVKYYDLSDGTYFAEGNLEGSTVFNEAKTVVASTLKIAHNKYPGVTVTGNVTVYRLAEQNAIYTTFPSTSKKPLL